jgi:hypothetical protein
MHPMPPEHDTRPVDIPELENFLSKEKTEFLQEETARVDPDAPTMINRPTETDESPANPFDRRQTSDRLDRGRSRLTTGEPNDFKIIKALLIEDQANKNRGRNREDKS